jgi:hypothetical protein
MEGAPRAAPFCPDSLSERYTRLTKPHPQDFYAGLLKLADHKMCSCLDAKRLPSTTDCYCAVVCLLETSQDAWSTVGIVRDQKPSGKLWIHPEQAQGDYEPLWSVLFLFSPGTNLEVVMAPFDDWKPEVKNTWFVESIPQQSYQAWLCSHAELLGVPKTRLSLHHQTAEVH